MAGYFVLVSIPLFLLIGSALGTETSVTGYVDGLRRIPRSGGDGYRFSVAGRDFATNPDAFGRLKAGDCVSVRYIESAFSVPSISLEWRMILSIALQGNDEACRSDA